MTGHDMTVRTPWSELSGTVSETRDRWNSRLSRHERRRAVQLLKDDCGLPFTLDARARAELRRLIAQLDLEALAQNVTPRSCRTRSGRALRGR